MLLAELIVKILVVSLVESYATFYLLFPNFSVGALPVIFVVTTFFITGLGTRMKELLTVAVVSPIVSFFVLQILAFVNFKQYTTYQILLTVLARGAVGFGVAWMLVGVVIGSVANLLFSKGNGNKEY
ncbi:hypothetical protein SAMN04488510_10576 [Fervidobacterium changbaicum]|uniref:Uncharacterized protein n=1 Tax=Fervidobacterium changbaicum TaxID=310769 RepID=A0AAE6CDY1_9BACT|nr:hypothetical protein [Fervidobacterium changbaicum]QAV33162.1 hypothetical protein CBS1_05095 [Fervidobacterium changbaicum]SDH12266.1 hypothetical protein SAMN04488510_10576 [Fervidobacterium changbaicum]